MMYEVLFKRQTKQPRKECKTRITQDEYIIIMIIIIIVIIIIIGLCV
jgi:hypothetical protein